MKKVNELWINILSSLETQISALAFDLWIKTIEPVCIYDNKLVLLTQTEANRSLIEKRYHQQIKSTMIKEKNTLIDCEIITPDQKDFFEESKTYDEYDEQDKIESTNPQSSNFITKYNFDNFVVGKSNEFVAAAAKAVAEAPGEKYNPLFIYGGVGLGKTHIMHSIGNFIKQHNPKIKCMYVSSERFTNELIDAIRDSKNPDSKQTFRKKYRNVDVLMIDDIQFIAKTVSTQEEFFHTFNDLYHSNKQIIISSDRPPKEIHPLEERLRTRFEGGLIADIQQPDLETRIAILQKKAQGEKYNISVDILRLLAEKVQSNIRELEGLLTKVISYASLTNQSPNNMEVVEQALKDYTNDKKEIVSCDTIIDCVTSYFNVDKPSLVGKKKNKEIVEPRQICIYLITEYLTVPLMAIGQIFGGRDHTTIMHSRDKISEQIKTDQRFATYVKDLKDMILKK